MSMMQVDIRLPELQTLVRDLGLEPGGLVQQHLVGNVARRIAKYAPKRTYSSVEHAIAQGTGAEKRAYRDSWTTYQISVFRQGNGRQTS